MQKTGATYPAGIFLFHRDLRLHDNMALNAALRQTQRVYPCFILDKTLLDQLGHELPRVQYLIAALHDLDAALQAQGSRLHVVFDTAGSGLQKLQAKMAAQAVFFHRDAGSFASHRDQVLQKICSDTGVACYVLDDITLHPPEKTVKKDGTPYSVFTPFFRAASQLPVQKPQKLAAGQLASLPGNACSLAVALQKAKIKTVHSLLPAMRARESLEKIESLQDYEYTRNMPSLTGTSRLSAPLRFGVVSSREVWWAIAQTLGIEHPLLRQLYWRDFFFSIGMYYPRVFKGCFHEQYNRIVWPDNQQWLTAWREGRTGFPIVDAGMRELHATGYMHNRVRMIVASFLVKDLHCDWRHGERHFAQQLIDYDPCINNGNWQWAASTGCDAQPYFRIFNPWTQQQKFDPDCVYIKHWLPELKNIPAKTLHNLFKLDKALPGYVMSIVDHGTQSQLAKRLFEETRSSPTK
jgi:deoxyribodipyrimidine photo-lyase